MSKKSGPSSVKAARAAKAKSKAALAPQPETITEPAQPVELGEQGESQLQHVMQEQAAPKVAESLPYLSPARYAKLPDAKKIKTHSQHLQIGQVTKKYVDLAKYAVLEVVIIGDKAEIGYHFFTDIDPNNAEVAAFTQLFANKKYVRLDPVDRTEQRVKEAEAEVAKSKAATDPSKRTRRSAEQRAADALEAASKRKVSKAREAGHRPWKEIYAERGMTRAKSIAEGRPMFRPGTKLETLHRMLVEGTTIEEISTALGWKKGSVAGAMPQIAATAQKTLKSEKQPNGPVRYSIV